MKRENISPRIKSNLDTKSEQYLKNKEMMLEKLKFLDGLLDLAEIGGGMHHHERLAKRGKMPVRQRVMNVLDQDSPFLEIQPFAALGTCAGAETIAPLRYESRRFAFCVAS